MTDETPRPIGVQQEKTTPLDEAAPDPGARRTPGRKPVAGGRVAAAGIGIAAMLGLVGNMELANGRTGAAKPAPTTALVSQPTAQGSHPGSATRLGKIAAAKASRPIVLTPHVVVHSVSAPATGGYSGGGGSTYAAAPRAAAAPAAAPVASSGGSH
jgi:hypothetical protein